MLKTHHYTSHTSSDKHKSFCGGCCAVLNMNYWLLLMEEILHQLVSSLPHYLQGFTVYIQDFFHQQYQPHERLCKLASMGSSQWPSKNDPRPVLRIWIVTQTLDECQQKHNHLAVHQECSRMSWICLANLRVHDDLLTNSPWWCTSGVQGV